MHTTSALQICGYFNIIHFPGSVAFFIINDIADFKFGQELGWSVCLDLDNGPIGPGFVVQIRQTLWAFDFILEDTVNK